MHDHNPTPLPANSSRWTEDRVERLLVAMFAEQPLAKPTPVRSDSRQGFQKAALVALTAACLALVVPMLSVSLDDDADNNRFVQWIGPKARPVAPSVDLALSDDVELGSESDDASANESDETAEAPSTTESEDSAST